MNLLLEWAENIPKEISKSRALLGRRKSAKSAIMQRLFNILWNKNGNVVPLYFEIVDQDQCLLDFASDYFFNFMSQYLSFRTRIPLLNENMPFDIDILIDMAKTAGEVHALESIERFKKYYETRSLF